MANRPLSKFTLRRFWGLFWPIFNSFCRGSIRSGIQPLQKELKTRLKRTQKSTEGEFRKGSNISFHKYHGAGNDFVLIDARVHTLPSDLAQLSRTVCHRNTGIGADGLLLLLPSSKASYRMRIFNADGSEPTMCGNGAYCLCHHLRTHEKINEPFTLETAHGILKCYNDVINLGPVAITHFPLALPEWGNCYVVNTGVIHAVLLHSPNSVEEEGRKIRFHPLFGPEGVNVNFIEKVEPHCAQIRTYERGIEGETLACGTGAAACAFVLKQLYGWKESIAIKTRIDTLLFSFPSQEIEMRGRATLVFSGTIVSMKETQNSG